MLGKVAGGIEGTTSSAHIYTEGAEYSVELFVNGASVGVVGGPDWVEINNILSSYGISADYETGFINTTNQLIWFGIRAGYFEDGSATTFINALKLYDTENATIVTSVVNPPFTLIPAPANTEDSFADIGVYLAPASP